MNQWLTICESPSIDVQLVGRRLPILGKARRLGVSVALEDVIDQLEDSKVVGHLASHVAGGVRVLRFKHTELVLNAKRTNYYMNL